MTWWSDVKHLVLLSFTNREIKGNHAFAFHALKLCKVSTWCHQYFQFGTCFHSKMLVLCNGSEHRGGCQESKFKQWFVCMRKLFLTLPLCAHPLVAISWLEMLHKSTGPTRKHIHHSTGNLQFWNVYCISRTLSLPADMFVLGSDEQTLWAPYTWGYIWMLGWGWGWRCHWLTEGVMGNHSSFNRLSNLAQQRWCMFSLFDVILFTNQFHWVQNKLSKKKLCFQKFSKINSSDKYLEINTLLNGC